MPVRPNLLWIVTTQWRAMATGYAGDVNARTPSLDTFASSAVNYTEAVTPHPFGPFARAALLTGVSSPENGISDYFDVLPPSTRTIAHDLNERGYDTAFFGKWHLGPRDRTAPLVGEAHARSVVPPAYRGGFKFWEGFESGFLLNDPWIHGSDTPDPIRLRGYQSDVLAERAQQWIGARAKAPWFVLLSLEAPHPPYHAPVPSNVGATDPDAIDLRSNVPSSAAGRARSELAGYYRHIEATDRAIGRLLTTLPGDVGIVITSAHGDMHGSHGRFRKGWPYEESVRVPLLGRSPLSAARGAALTRAPISLIDVPAMTRAWADSTTWQCTGSRAEISMPSVVALPDQCDRPWRGWRSPEHKSIALTDGTPWLEFDLLRDPFERTNLVQSKGTGRSGSGSPVLESK